MTVHSVEVNHFVYLEVVFQILFSNSKTSDSFLFHLFTFVVKKSTTCSEMYVQSASGKS